MVAVEATEVVDMGLEVMEAAVVVAVMEEVDMAAVDMEEAVDILPMMDTITM